MPVCVCNIDKNCSLQWKWQEFSLRIVQYVPKHVGEIWYIYLTVRVRVAGIL